MNGIDLQSFLGEAVAIATDIQQNPTRNGNVDNVAGVVPKLIVDGLGLSPHGIDLVLRR